MRPEVRPIVDEIEQYVSIAGESLLSYERSAWELYVRWMLRIVNLPAALSGRGYQQSVEGEIHFDIEDEVLADNNGRWVLELADGSARVARGGDGWLKMHIRALAPLFSAL